MQALFNAIDSSQYTPWIAIPALLAFIFICKWAAKQPWAKWPDR